MFRLFTPVRHHLQRQMATCRFIWIRSQVHFRGQQDIKLKVLLMLALEHHAVQEAPFLHVRKLLEALINAWQFLRVRPGEVLVSAIHSKRLDQVLGVTVSQNQDQRLVICRQRVALALDEIFLVAF